MHAPRVVLDTNVLVAALHSRRGRAFQLLSLVGTGHFDTAVSVPLVFEYEDVLARETIGIPTAAAVDVIDYLCLVSHRQEVHFLWRPFLKDPKDDLVLELAVASQSTIIVTYNIKDFEGGASFGVRALRPAGLLAELGVKL
ncbi:MAG: putative toxin-antitoxin system toxin component, PIN family [Nitrococcus sp.]|nr:putative toxin-antitoxin system toxin component, PIN family [Nitrococcus sp.]